MSKKLELSKEAREDAINHLKYFFSEERDEEIGDLAAMLLLDFIIENIATEFYNLGIKDSIHFMNEKIDDLYSLEK